MADGEIEINAARLTAGGDSCDYAAGSARKAHEQLSSAPLASGIFGSFAEADAFHAKLSEAHRSHRERLESHHAVLMDLSEKSSLAARTFVDTDESAADHLRAAGDRLK